MSFLRELKGRSGCYSRTDVYSIVERRGEYRRWKKERVTEMEEKRLLPKQIKQSRKEEEILEDIWKTWE